MLVTYRSNNSGGSWWLKDADWIALEKAGWTVEWGGCYFCHSDFSIMKAPAGKPEPCPKGIECQGHRKCENADEAAKSRYMGALAKEARKDLPDLGSAIREWEAVTGKTASDEGCNCCGAPHCFSADKEYASGDGCLPYLFPGRKIPGSLREAMEAQPTPHDRQMEGGRP